MTDLLLMTAEREYWMKRALDTEAERDEWRERYRSSWEKEVDAIARAEKAEARIIDLQQSLDAATWEKVEA